MTLRSQPAGRCHRSRWRRTFPSGRGQGQHQPRGSLVGVEPCLQLIGVAKVGDARPAGRVAPGAKVTVAGVVPDGPVDGGPQVMRAAIRAKASRHAARNPSRARRLIAGPRRRRHLAAGQGRFRVTPAAAGPRTDSPPAGRSRHATAAASGCSCMGYTRPIAAWSSCMARWPAAQDATPASNRISREEDGVAGPPRHPVHRQPAFASDGDWVRH
jgi:hypothetical protein